MVGPLEDSAGNIISQGFLMADDLNGYFSLTREDISSLPVPDAKFQDALMCTCAISPQTPFVLW